MHAANELRVLFLSRICLLLSLFKEQIGPIVQVSVWKNFFYFIISTSPFFLITPFPPPVPALLLPIPTHLRNSTKFPPSPPLFPPSPHSPTSLTPPLPPSSHSPPSLSPLLPLPLLPTSLHFPYFPPACPLPPSPSLSSNLLPPHLFPPFFPSSLLLSFPPPIFPGPLLAISSPFVSFIHPLLTISNTPSTSLST